MNRINTKDGRVFVLVGEEPYQRKDGVMTTLKVWRSNCAVCGAPFTVKTPTSFSSAGDSKSFGAKHCADHKLTREEATARWQDAIKAGRIRKNETI
jgi:hypothetical protein